MKKNRILCCRKYIELILPLISALFLYFIQTCEIINVHPVRDVKKQTQIKVPNLNYIF